MFEVLMFIFENYMDSNISLKTDSQTIVVELEKVGFTRYEIDRALDWLDGLNRFQTAVESGPMIATQSIRHFLPEENLYLQHLAIPFLLVKNDVWIASQS